MTVSALELVEAFETVQRRTRLLRASRKVYNRRVSDFAQQERERQRRESRLVRERERRGSA